MPRRVSLACLFALALAVPVPALSAEAPVTVTVSLSNFKFTPQDIPLEHGRAYVLHLENAAGGGHDFAAPEFFAAAMVDPADQGKVEDGRVRLSGGESADIHLTAPAAGTYKVRCTHFMHAGFGMTGSISVS